MNDAESTKSSKDGPVPEGAAVAAQGGRLYLVATPIGNLADVTLRALQVLQEVDLLLAEDTRRSRKLLSHHGIRARLSSLHEHNEAARVPAVLAALARGESVALVSDAGTPGISDPGYRLVREAVAAGFPVVPVPGPSAPIAALVASGLPTDSFAFLGYPPRTPARRRRFLEPVAGFGGTLVLLESPLRLAATLATAAEVLGAQRPAAVARELTKAHEEIVRGSLAELAARFGDTPPRGEVTLCIGPADRADRGTVVPEVDLRRRYAELQASGLERREALRRLAEETGLHRRELYRQVVLEAGTPNACEERP